MLSLMATAAIAVVPGMGTETHEPGGTYTEAWPAEEDREEAVSLRGR
jgi:hypothetical protein